MNPIRRTPAALVLAACAPLSLAGAANPDASCQDDFDQGIADCDNNFGPDGFRPDEYADQECKQGARDGFQACLDGADRDDLLDAWLGFLAGIRDCINRDYDNPTSTEACIDGALILYKHQVEEALGGDDDACDFRLPGWSSRIAALADAQDPGEDIDISAGASMSFNAGAGVASSGNEQVNYDVREVDCVKSAMLFEAYPTRQGARVRAVDADTNMSDGVRLRYHASATRLVDAQAVRLFVLYRDDAGVPLFLEHARLGIRETGVGGDWDRDGVRDASDMLEFLGSYSAGVDRADLDGDGSVGEPDAVEYLNQMTED